MSDLTLYTYFRSSTSFRVRIALNLEGLPYTPVFVNLARGEHKSDWFRRMNPRGVLPVLQHNEPDAATPFIVSGSLPIVEYLSWRYSRLIVGSAKHQAYIRMLADAMNDAQVLINRAGVRPMIKELGNDCLGGPEKVWSDWTRGWASIGLMRVEKMLERFPKGIGDFCLGSHTQTLADVWLVPLVYAAKRENYPFEKLHPALARIFEKLMKRSDFQLAAPENQPDAKEGFYDTY